MLKYVFSILLFIIVSQPTLVFADDHEDLISGVINAISIDDNGNVEGILLMMNNGDFVNISLWTKSSQCRYRRSDMQLRI